MDKRVSVIDNELKGKSLHSEEMPRDILLLARHFIKTAEEQVNTGHKELSTEAEEYILGCDWNGNDKGLESAVKKACILSEGQALQREDFDLGYREVKSIGRFIEERLKGFMRNIKNFERFNLYDTVIPEVEKALILMIMKETKGNQLKTAKLLGINRNTLRNKIKKFKISVKS